MRLTRCKDQKSKTLEEFYGELVREDGYVGREGGKAMLDLIGRLRVLPDNRLVFGLTSHARLVLLAEDTYESPWFVIVSALDKRNYFVEYLMTESVAPWPGAYVRGECRSEDDAVRMIETAMDRCEGWRSRHGMDG
ncbi:MAG: hypothetical protein QM770_17960 [Tepidisphaeraceae bacterium]